jgi:uncharacterized membrane protein YidH (DUF202 family)
MSQFDADSRDPGLAAERTDLAWNRSALSMVACGAVVMRGLADTRLPRADLAIGACILALGVLTWALGSWHIHRSRTRGDRRTTPADLLPVTLGVGVVGVAAFILAALSPN